MDIHDYKEERTKADQQLSAAEAAIKAAGEIYDEQKKALKNIQKTAGFQEILKYFHSRKEACEEYFRGTDNDPSYNLRLKGRYDEICKFIQFLENITA